MIVHEDEDPMGVASTVFAKEIAAGTVTLHTRKREKPICTECGSDSIVVDANAEWDVDAADWVVSCTFNDASCGECEGGCSIEWVEVDRKCDTCWAYCTEAEMGDGTCKRCEAATYEKVEAN
jgi:hypothetical protein